MKIIFDVAKDGGKINRIAATGMLGEYLSFIMVSREIDNDDKVKIGNSVNQFLISLCEKKVNRAAKERFSLALEKISKRFPQILTD